MNEADFFVDPKEQSLVKIEIVRKYFFAWAKVLIPRSRSKGNKVAYVDLFCGPGRYQDGTESTPLHILQTIIRDPSMHDKFVLWFNDKNPEYTENLQREINALPGIEHLTGRRTFTNYEIGSEIITTLKKSKMPTLFFVDPFGYKGLSIELINAALENWGCDCIFFFNYNRVNSALTNLVFRESMASVFGEARATQLTQQLASLSPNERELTIVEAITQALNESGQRYVLPFRFKPTAKTSHHLFFVSKNVLGYEIMKEIMAKEGSGSSQGVADFEYNTATIRQPLLFAYAATMDDLSGLLLEEYAGRTMTMQEVYHAHNIGRPFLEKNYKHILLVLEAEGKISTEPSKRRKGTFGDNVKVTFPPLNR